MQRSRVYDWPTRLFHWLFAGSFLAAFLIAKNIDDDSPVFSVHMMLGLTLGFLVFLRFIWGFTGTRHARFSGFDLNPVNLFGYLKGIVTGDKRKWAGHNPASSWAALAMMICGVGLVASGWNMTSGPNKEDFEDFHELFANGFFLLVLAHFAGIFTHTIRHRELIGLSMIDGKKSGVAQTEVIESARPLIALVFLALVASFGGYLYKSYDPQTRVLNVLGTPLRLGEAEEGKDAESDGRLELDDENHGEDDGQAHEASED